MVLFVKEKSLSFGKKLDQASETVYSLEPTLVNLNADLYCPQMNPSNKTTYNLIMFCKLPATCLDWTVQLAYFTTFIIHHLLTCEHENVQHTNKPFSFQQIF